LFDFLVAKTLNGKFILRIEDTDQKREVEGAVDGLINILDWVTFLNSVYKWMNLMFNLKI